jgi:hypothetical protein
MKDIDDDCAPDITDPLLDEFTWAAEGQEERVIFERVAERLEVVRTFQNRVAVTATEAWNADPTMLHVEALIAVTGLFCGFADHLLKTCDMATFEANRAEVRKVIGLLTSHVNSIAPDEAQLAELKTTGMVN